MEAIGLIAPLLVVLLVNLTLGAISKTLASVVTLIDLTGAAREMNSRFYLPFEAFLTAGAFYLVLTFILVGAFRAAENRWLVHLKPRS